MNETFTPQKDSTPDYTDMISGVLALTDEQLENLRKRINSTLAERSLRRKNELFNKFCKAYRDFRAEFPDETHFVEVKDDDGNYFDVDMMEEFDRFCGKGW